MADQRDVVVLVGSLRKDSFNRKIARALAQLAPANLKLEIVEIRDLTFYDQDLDEKPPASWVAFRERIKRADAVLFVTPEYNRSVPGVLKNAVDIGSRPYGHNVFDGKPTGVISVTIGTTGAFGANHHLRQTLAYLNAPTLGQPEVYISAASTLMNAAGEVTNDKTREILTNFGAKFAAWIERFAKR